MSLHDLRGLELDAADILYAQLPSTGVVDIPGQSGLFSAVLCTEKATDDRLGLSLTCLTAPLANNHSRVVSRLWRMQLRDSKQVALISQKPTFQMERFASHWTAEMERCLAADLMDWDSRLFLFACLLSEPTASSYLVEAT